MNLKQIFEIGDKRTPGVWWQTTHVPTLVRLKRKILPFEIWCSHKEDAEYIATAPIMEAKLREIAEMLPGLKQYLTMQSTHEVELIIVNRETGEQTNLGSVEKKLLEKLDKWENE